MKELTEEAGDCILKLEYKGDQFRYLNIHDDTRGDQIKFSIKDGCDEKVSEIIDKLGIFGVWHDWEINGITSPRQLNKSWYV